MGTASLRGGILVATLSALLLLPALAAAPEAPHELQVRYTGGGGATGHVTAHCAAAFVTLPAGTTTTMSVEEATWQVVETRRQRTDEAPTPTLAEGPPQRGDGSHVVPLGAGRLTLSLGTHDGWILPGTPDHTDPNPLTPHIRTTTMGWTSVSDARTITEHYWHDHPPEPVGILSAPLPSEPERQTLATHHIAAAAEPTRLVHVTNGVMTITGELAVLVRGGTMTHPDHAETLPAPDRLERDAAGSARVFTDGWVVARNVTWHMAAPITAACGDMTHHVVGDLTWQRASGRYTTDADPVPFTDRLVTVRGDMQTQDTAAREGASARTTGTLALIATDGRVAEANPGIPSALIASAGITGLLAWGLRGHLFTWATRLYTRIQQDSVLDHPVRALIMDHIAANPGTNVHAASAALELSRSVVRHHVSVLVAAGIVQRHRLDGEVLLLPADQGHGPERALINAKPALRFLVEATRHEAVLRRDLVQSLAGHLDISESGARKWITRAERLGILNAHGQGHGVRYRCAW